MKTMGYAVVGTGYFGAELARIMNKQENARVVAVYDPENAQEIAKELNCDVEVDFDVLYSREDVDAVIIASPNYLHKEPVLKAAEHKVHVFCEKPISLSYKDCDDMVRACDENNVTFMAGHVMNFFRGVRHAKELINSGVIGDVLFCHSARNGWEDKKPEISWKKIREKSGGHLYHHIHEMDCIHFIMGSPETATMVGGNVAHDSEGFGDEDDMLLITLEFPNKKYAILEYGSAFRWGEHYVLIQGTKGAIKLDMNDSRMTVKYEDGSEKLFTLHESEEEDEDRRNTYTKKKGEGAITYGRPGNIPPMWLVTIMNNEMKYFNDIMHGMEPDAEFKPLLNGSAARNVIATADALTLSLKENRKVSLKEITGR